MVVSESAAATWTTIPPVGGGPQSVASALARRRTELEAQLSLVEATLRAPTESLAPLLRQLEPIVTDRVNAQRERLKKLPASAAEQWSVLSDVASTTERLAADALAFVGGVAVRSLGLDGGVCDIADALLRHLAGELRIDRKFVTLPSSTDYHDVLSEVVRVRYPGAGIWDLPIAIHEFGHYAVPRIGVRRGQPVQAVIDRQRADRPYLGWFAEELFCDVFATYVAGPAYGFSAAARLDPTRAHQDHKPTHPSPATRMAAVLHTIDALQAAWAVEGRAAGSLQAFRKNVAELWKERTDSAGQQPEPTDDERQFGTSMAAEFVSILDGDEACLSNRFDDGTAAWDVIGALDRREAPGAHHSMLDIVNAGWLVRRANERGRGDRVEEITKLVSQACATIAGGGNDGS